jgi:hypothetical protein
MRNEKVKSGIILMVMAYGLKFFTSAWNFTIKVTKQGPYGSYQEEKYLKELHILCALGGEFLLILGAILLGVGLLVSALSALQSGAPHKEE